jgi:phage shock protein PspC (stress-responsive transcriptional regulator)
MTESTAFIAAPPLERRLERPRDSAFRGVCSAIARHTGTDPVLWRVLMLVLMFFNGLGLVLYVAGVVAIPREDQERSLAARLVNGPDRRLTRNQTLLLILLLILAVGYIRNPSGVVVAAVAVVIGFLWWRGKGDAPVGPAAPAAPVAEWISTPPLPPRPRSPLGGITASIAAVVAGVLVLVGATGTHTPVAVPIAAALGVVGLGLVAGSYFGRSWGLFLLAAALTASLGAAAAAQPLLDDGVGKRDWSPTGSASYRLGAGKGVLDLSSVAPTADITAHVGYGQLLVVVPTSLALTVDAEADYGDVDLFGKADGGRHYRQTFTDPDATVHLHLDVRAGEVKVVRQ